MSSLSRAVTILHLVLLAQASRDSFHESLTLHPLPDGKLSVLFEFTTHFSSSSGSSVVNGLTASHHSLTPPALLLPLEQNGVAELSISFSAGQWDQRRSSECGPLEYETGGGGGEVRGWLRNKNEITEWAIAFFCSAVPQPVFSTLTFRTDDNWTRVTHALGGLFCAGLGPSEDEDSVTNFGAVYPPARHESTNLTHFLLPHPFLHLCTENLTPFLALLPSKGLSGLSSLLAQPQTIFSWGYKSEGIEAVMPSVEAPGHWRGWWEGIVDLADDSTPFRDFSIQSLFHKPLPRAFPEADSSTLRLISPRNGKLAPLLDGYNDDLQWIDGALRQVISWDLLETSATGQNAAFHWEDEYKYAPREPLYRDAHEFEVDYVAPLIEPPIIILSRTATKLRAAEGTFSIRITNNGFAARNAVYSEVWPWWLKGWISEVTAATFQGNISIPNPNLLTSMSYHPSTPPKISSTVLHLHITLPPQSTVVLEIPFTKLTLKYNDHRPDAERGREIPSGILTLLDLLEEGDASSDDVGRARHPNRSGRRRLYTSRLLLDVPTPDFSMPYNVIIMSSTVMAVFFGLMQGSLVRRWGWIEVPPTPTKADVEDENGIKESRKSI